MHRSVLAILIAGSSASAQSMDSGRAALNIGTVIASESACGLTYDQNAIAAWISANVAATDMDFAPLLSTMIMGQEFQLAEMSPSALTAHCAAISQSARAMGFTN